jgi:hypothetical protein
MSSNREINEPLGANPEAMIARWVPIGRCIGVTGTTGKLVKTCSAASATNIVIATRIAADTAIRTTEAGIARTETEMIEATMNICLGGG